MKYVIDTTPSEIAKSQQALCQLMEFLPLESNAFDSVKDLKTLIGVLARIRTECDTPDKTQAREFALDIAP